MIKFMKQIDLFRNVLKRLLLKCLLTFFGPYSNDAVSQTGRVFLPSIEIDAPIYRQDNCITIVVQFDFHEHDYRS